METHEQKISVVTKNKKVKLIIALVVIVVILIAGYFIFFSNGASTPSLDIIPYKAGDKWGYIDREGKIVINPQFNSATVFIDGLALVQSADNKYGYIGVDGKYRIKPTYKSALPFSEGLACVVPENGKPQFIDEKGNLKFTVNTGEFCGSFFEGLACIKVDGKYGFIDKTGKIKINTQFFSASLNFSDKLAAVGIVKEDKGAIQFGFINDNGELVINYQFKRIDSQFIDGLALVWDGKNYGYIDKKGKYVINPQFEKATEFKNGLAIIDQGGMKGYIDKEGKIVINPQFKNASLFSSNDIAAVKSSDGKYGYIDKDGKYIINPQFERASDFFEDIAFVHSADKWGIIDQKGKYIVNPQFDEIEFEFERYKYRMVESDYFDMDGIIQKWLVNTDKENFKGINCNTNFSQIKKEMDIDNDFIDNNHIDFFTNKYDLSREVVINRIQIYFDNFITGREPVYRTVQRYDYWKGWYDAKEIAYYQYYYNEDAVVSTVHFTLSFMGKAINKRNDILNALSDEIATILASEKQEDVNCYTILSKNISIDISKKDGIITLYCSRNTPYDKQTSQKQLDVLNRQLDDALEEINKKLDYIDTNLNN